MLRTWTTCGGSRSSGSCSPSAACSWCRSCCSWSLVVGVVLDGARRLRRPVRDGGRARHGHAGVDALPQPRPGLADAGRLAPRALPAPAAPALAVLGAAGHAVEVLLRLPRAGGDRADGVARSSVLLLPEDAQRPVAAPPHCRRASCLATAIVILFTTPLQAIGEEYGFRGYLMQAFGSFFDGSRVGRAVAASPRAALFRAGPRRAELPAVLRPVRLRPHRGRPRDAGRRSRGRHRAAHPEQPARLRRRDRPRPARQHPQRSPRRPGGSCR